MKILASKQLREWVTLCGRLLLGGVLLVAGYLKAKNLTEATASVRVYKLLPVSIANILGEVLPWLEIGVALLIITGIFTKQQGAFSLRPIAAR